MISTDDLHYSLIHPETITAEYPARGCWLVVTAGLCDGEVGYPPGVLVCAPAEATDPAFRCFAPKSKDGMWDRPWFWNASGRSRFFPSASDAFQHPDWFGTAEYGRHGSKWTDEAIERELDPNEPLEPTSDEVRVTSDTGGAKGSKQCQMGWVPAFVMEELGNLYGLGAKKYGDPLNYIKGYDWSLSYNALLRHFWAWMGGESHDPKDGQHHLASVIWHAIALQYFEAHHPEFDDRLSTREEADVGIVVETPVGVTKAPGTGWTQTSRITEIVWAGADETCFRNADEVEGAPV